MKDSKVKIYTDGAARGNPGPAGWAAVVLLTQNSGEPRVLVELGGKLEHATNNIMELTAAIQALKYLPELRSKAGVKKLTPQDYPVGQVEIISDSKYVILGITEWIAGWQKNNWRNAAKKPVANRELWEELYELNQELKPKWTYVKGHDENKYNNRADEIATGLAGGEEIVLKK